MDFEWMVEIVLVFVRGPEITCFIASIEIDSLFCTVVEVVLISVKGVELDLI